MSTENKQNINKFILRCPHCNAEYQPAEIFYPNSVFGKPKNVIKDLLGKIIFVEYNGTENEPNFNETYTCDYCGKPFIAKTVLNFKTETEAEELDFSNQFSSLL